MRLAEQLRLMVIVDPDHCRSAPLEVVRSVVEAGAPALQIRVKTGTSRELFEFARAAMETIDGRDCLLIVNDRFDVALAAGADGVHVGPDDLPVADIRSSVPEGFVVGASTDDPRRAQELERAGADYLGTGTVFPTSSKSDAGTAIGVEGLAKVVAAVQIPVVGIGGIHAENARLVRAGGCAGIAVLGAICSDPNPAGQVERLLL